MSPHIPAVAAMFSYRHHGSVAGVSNRRQLAQRQRPLLPASNDVGPDASDTDVFLPSLVTSTGESFNRYTEMVNGGLVLPLLVACRNHGYEPRIAVDWAYPAPRRDRKGGKSADAMCGHVLDMLELSLHGVIRHQLNLLELAQLMEAIAIAFPDAKLAFVSARTETLIGLRRLLSARFLRETTSSDAEDHIENPRRVMLCTPYGMTVCMPDPLSRRVDDHRRHLTFVLDATEVTHERMQTALRGQHTGLFGLLRVDAALPPRTRDLIFAAFGPEMTTLPKLRYRSRRVETLFCKPLEIPFQSSALQRLEQVRREVWLNDVRNRGIAALAFGLSQGSVDVNRFAARLTAPWRRPLNVVVITESLEHAQNLGRLLYSWPIVADDDAYCDDLPPGPRPVTASVFATGTGSRAIATTASVRQLPWDRIETVVWAGGGSGGAPLPVDLLTCLTTEDRRLLLVDVNDRATVELRKDTATRRRRYEALDWFRLGRDADAARTQRYWRERELQV